MNYLHELRSMDERVLAGGLLERVEAAYNIRLRETGCGKLADEYEAGKAALCAQLDTALISILNYNEKLHNTNLGYAVKHAFKNGICAVFERYFSDTPSDDPFEKYVVDELIGDSKPYSHKEYRECRDKVNDRMEHLSELFESERSEYVDAISAYWEDSEYGILPYAFALGCSCAETLLSQTLGKPFSIGFGKDLPGLDFEAEQNAALDRILDKELANKLLEQKEPECFERLFESDYSERYKDMSTAAFLDLDIKGIDDLAYAEKLFEINLLYALRFAFAGGMYAGFEQIFDKDDPNKHFLDVASDLVYNEFIPKERKSDRAEEYIKRENEISEIFEQLTKKLKNKNKELADVHDYLRFVQGEKLVESAFYLGYRYALNAADSDIIQTRKMRLKILRSEFDLHIISLRETREYRSNLIEHLKNPKDRNVIKLQDFDMSFRENEE